MRWLKALDRTFHGITGAAAASLLLLLLGLLIVLYDGARPALLRFGPGFVLGSSWDGAHDLYGAYPAIAGTLLSSGLALLFAIPVALGVALFLSEMAPPWLREPLAYVVDLSAAVPSVVYGFWAFYVLVPFVRSTVEPGLASLTGGTGPFSGSPTGLDLFTASIVLAIMIVPTIAAFSREALRAVPRSQREAAMSLGATSWEASRLAVLGPARRGIVAGVILGLGRAIGETIAVAMVIGNIYLTPTSLFSPAQTLASLIVNNFGGVGPGLERSALFEVGLLLLAVTVGVNVLARLLLGQTSEPRGPRRPAGFRLRASALLGRQHHPLPHPVSPASASAGADSAVAAGRWSSHLVDRVPKNLRRRRALHWVVVSICAGALLLAILPLASVLTTAFDRGGGAVIQPSFYVSENPLGCNPGPGRSCSLGGIGPEIQGTLLLLGLGALVAMPLGILAGIYLSEYGRRGRSRFARGASFVADVLTGVPTILLGVFVFAVFLRLDHDSATSALSGGFALGAVMVPLVARATEEGLRTVSTGVREAALALGFTRHRMSLRVVLGSARNAVVTGALLGLSRAAGDTAALFVTAGSSSFWFQGFNQPTAALTPFIFTNFGSEYANLASDAWGAALVLLLMMLLISVGARWVVRSRSVGAEL
ncbi:MAG: phosphate ABC transporter permease subunit PstC [Thermoplasmata archaeon]|nr:phosphate ABC transporter permease subunit PstC [Thermoplasmata archaeon]